MATIATKPKAGTPESHQSWINDPRSGLGGMDKYVTTQQERLNQALSGGDNDLVSRLYADAQRVGYSLNDPTKNTQATQPTAPSFVDQQKQQITDIYNNQHQSQLQGLRQQRDTALQGLNKVETQAKQSAYDNRNQADAANAQAAQRLREAMANMGLLNSGDNLTNVAALNSQRQSALGQINQQETNALTDVQERRKMINDNASGNELALMQALQAEQARQLLDLGYRAEDINFRNNQFDWTKGIDLAGLTGSYNGQRTIAGQTLDWNKDPNNPSNQAQIISNQINQLKLENLPQELKLGLDSLEQDIKLGKINLQQAEFQLKELTNPNSITNQSKRLALEASKLGNQELMKRIEQIGKEPVLTEYEKQMQQIKLDTAKLELDRLQNPPPSTPKPTTIDAKTSTDNLSGAKTQMRNLTEDEARKYAQGIKDYLTDADYRALIKYIDDEF